jgi:hypothetical protein
MKNIFDKTVAEGLISRIDKLNTDSNRVWGSMDAAQMLAHCNVTYEMIYEEGRHPKAKGFKKFILKMFIKPIVVTEKTYKKNSPTAPAFIVKSDKNFDDEKERLVNYIRKTSELGTAHFEGKESNSFGVLNSTEWNNMLFKHLDHHLSQFGV